MSIGTRFTLCFFLLLSLCAIGFGQATDPAAAAAVSGGGPGYAAKAPTDFGSVAGVPSVSSSMVFDATTGAVIGGPGGNASVNNHAGTQAGNDDHFDVDDARPNKPTIPGLDTVATFDGAFFAQA